MHQGKKITTLEAFALSLAAIAPTGAMAFNTSASAKFAGVNIPISFALGAVAILFVGMCFAYMSKSITGIGSVYSYNRKAMGERTGFITAWLLTLTYLTFSAGDTGLAADFTNVFLSHFGIHVPVNVLAYVILIIILALLLFGLTFVSKLALYSESIAILILFVLCGIILYKHGLTSETFTPFNPAHTSASGLGQGMIYAINCYAGFEGATTVATRTEKPKKEIPRAILGTIIVSALIFIAVSYSEVVGFGIRNVQKLADSQSPLNYLAAHYMNSGMAILIDLAVLLSSLAGLMGMMNAGAYMLNALGKQHYLPKFLGKFDYKYNCPKHAIIFEIVLCAVLYAVIGLPFGAELEYTDLCGVGTLSLIIVYMMVCVGTFIYFKRSSQYHFSIFRHAVVPTIAFIVLLFPLWTTVYPVPQFPMNLYPYFLILWVVIGLVMSIYHGKSVRE